MLISFKRRGGSFIEVDADIIEFDGVQISLDALAGIARKSKNGSWMRFDRGGENVLVGTHKIRDAAR